MQVDAAAVCDLVLQALDKVYQCEYDFEAPAMCVEYFEKFSRSSDETLSEYEIRER